MERRTLQILRSLALRTTCTAITLDVRLMPGDADATPLLAMQLDGLLGAVEELRQWALTDLQGQVAPGVGGHVLDAIADALPVPSMVDLDAGTVFAHPELRLVLGCLSQQLAAGQTIDEVRLRNTCQQLRDTIAALKTGDAL